jgi:hypothetical protein
MTDIKLIKIESFGDIYFNQNIDKELIKRLQCDFEKKLYSGFSIIKNGALIGSVIYFVSFHIYTFLGITTTNIWLNDNQIEESKRDEIFQMIITNLNNIAKDLECKKLTFISSNESHNYINELINNSNHIGKMIDYYNDTRRSLFDMDMPGMIELINSPQNKIPSNFIIKKVNENENSYCELAQSIERCLKYYTNDLKDEEKYTIPNVDYLIEFKDHYDCFLLIDNDKKQVIGHAISCKTWDTQKGNGYFLNDIFINKEYHSRGLGVCLWAASVKDSIDNHNINFYRWTVHDFPKVIQFYSKWDVTNRTEKDNFSYFKIVN